MLYNVMNEFYFTLLFNTFTLLDTEEKLNFFTTVICIWAKYN